MAQQSYIFVSRNKAFATCRAKMAQWSRGLEFIFGTGIFYFDIRQNFSRVISPACFALLCVGFKTC
jgi:hypothetical protein